MFDRTAHWNAVYRERGGQAASWFEEEPQSTYDIVRAHATAEDAVIDVGGGASRLVDQLRTDGYRALSVLDLSETALELSRERLGGGADVDWISADVTGWTPPALYKLWHDRAVFHFLTDPVEQTQYVLAMDEALAPGGTAVIATFAPDGPENCADLPVIRYDSASLAKQIDALRPGRFQLVEAHRRQHLTPKGDAQSFQISVFRKAN